MKIIYSNNNQTSLVLFLMFTFCMAGVSGFFINEAKIIFRDWQIIVPSWSIPLWALTPIWTFFYFFLAITQWVSWGEFRNTNVLYQVASLLFWCIQVVFSGLWSLFLYVDPLGGIFIIFTIALIIPTILCIIVYKKINSYLSIVVELWYFLWCCYLIFFILFLQKDNNYWG